MPLLPIELHHTNPVTVTARYQRVESALAHLDHSINSNRRPDGLYHSYNLVDFGETAYSVEPLAEMLEGQVAVLGSGLLDAEDGLALLDALKRSDLYRADQQSYLLYPDRETKSFLDRNVVPEPLVRESRVIRRELSSGRTLLVEQDLHGKVHFNSAIAGSEELRAAINRAGNLDAEDASELLDIYEAVFRHRAFTGRSSSMYKYEGLGCIYWHMVSKLLLGVGELVADARSAGRDEALLEALAAHAEEIRAGLGLRKSPDRYGAIPLDPYSHTPGFAGVQQPDSWDERARDLLDVPGKEQVNWIEYFDSARNHYRAARFSGTRLESCLFIGPDKQLPPRDWLAALFQKEQLTVAERASLLSGLPPANVEDSGRTICSCFSVGEKTILKAIREQGLTTPEEIGDCLKAGTNCGSCIPDLKALLTSADSE